MKKILPVLAIMLLLFSGCKKETLVIPSISSSYYIVKGTQWSATGDHAGWFVDFDTPQITQEILDNGAVSVYVVATNSVGSEILQQLPFTFQSSGHTYSFFVQKGSVEIQFKNGSSGPISLPDEKYKIVVFSNK